MKNPENEIIENRSYHMARKRRSACNGLRASAGRAGSEFFWSERYAELRETKGEKVAAAEKVEVEG